MHQVESRRSFYMKPKALRRAATSFAPPQLNSQKFKQQMNRRRGYRLRAAARLHSQYGGRSALNSHRPDNSGTSWNISVREAWEHLVIPKESATSVHQLDENFRPSYVGIGESLKSGDRHYDGCDGSTKIIKSSESIGKAKKAKSTEGSANSCARGSLMKRKRNTRNGCSSKDVEVLDRPREIHKIRKCKGQIAKGTKGPQIDQKLLPTSQKVSAKISKDSSMLHKSHPGEQSKDSTESSESTVARRSRLKTYKACEALPTCSNKLPLKHKIGKNGSAEGSKGRDNQKKDTVCREEIVVDFTYEKNRLKENTENAALAHCLSDLSAPEINVPQQRQDEGNTDLMAHEKVAKELLVSYLSRQRMIQTKKSAFQNLQNLQISTRQLISSIETQ